MDDPVLDAISQLMRDGMSIPGIVLQLVDSEFSFSKIGELFVRLGHFVALGRGSSDVVGEMLIADKVGALEVGSTATTISWGGNGSARNQMPFRNQPEEVLVCHLKKSGVAIGEIVAKLVEIGLTGSELRALFTRLEYTVDGGGYGEAEGWLIISEAAEFGKENLARVHWGMPSEKPETSFPVLWK